MKNSLMTQQQQLSSVLLLSLSLAPIVRTMRLPAGDKKLRVERRSEHPNMLTSCRTSKIMSVSSSTTSAPYARLLALTLITTLIVTGVDNAIINTSSSIATTAHAAKIFSYECQGSTFSSGTQAIALCTAIDAVVATPITAAENAAAHATITSGGAVLGGLQVEDGGWITWRWYQSPNDGEIFWVQPNKATGTGGYAPSVYTAWASSYPLDDVPSYLVMRADGLWVDDGYNAVKCAICQKEACSSACYPAGTATPTGTWWPSCTCTCRPGWVGKACNRQIEVYPVSISTSADLEAVCAGKGGFLAQPKDRAEEDAILRVLTAAVAGDTDFTKEVSIGAYDTVTDGTYCYHDGPRSGECISVGGTVVVGQYSDFDGSVPTGGGRTQAAIDTLEHTDNRWMVDKPQDTDQVACQFIDCSQICHSEGTETASGTYLTTCACTCKSYWKGTLCDTQITPTLSLPLTATTTLPSTPTASMPRTPTMSIKATPTKETESNSHPHTSSLTHPRTSSPSARHTRSIQVTPTLSYSITGTQGTPTPTYVSTRSATSTPTHLSTNTQPTTISLSRLPTTSRSTTYTQSMASTLSAPRLPTRSNTPSSSITVRTQTSSHPLSPTITLPYTVSELSSSSRTLSPHSLTLTPTMSHPHTLTHLPTSTLTHQATQSAPHTKSDDITDTDEKLRTLTTSIDTTPTLTKISPTTTFPLPVVNDFSNDTTQRTCPAVTMLLYSATSNTTSARIPSNTIEDTEVSEGRLVVNISLVGTQFAFGSSMPSTIQFTVESTGVQDPRSFPAVVNANDVVCAFSPPTLRQFIVCTFPPSPDYKLRVVESLMVWGGGSGLNPPCTDSPWLLGRIRVEPSTEDVITQIFQVLAAIATGVATAVVMLLADGTPIEVQVMIVLLNSLCASDVDRKSVALVRYFLSPAIHLGWEWVVVVNVCIAVGFAALHSGLVVAVYAYRVRQARTAHKTSGKKKVRVGSKKRYEISLEVSAALLYPGLPLAVCHVLYIGVACGTFDVLRTKDGSEAAISALGIIFLVAVPIIDAYLLRRVIKVAYVPYDLLGCVPKTGCLRWLYPVGVWGPTASVRRFFGLIGPYRDGYRYGALIPLLLALIIGLTMHGLNDIVPCDYLFVVNAFIIILVAALYVATRPTRATAQALLTALCLLCVGILAVLQIVAIRNNSTAIEAAKSALNYMVVFMVIVRSSHNIFVAYVEWKWAREVDAAAIGTTATATISNTADKKPPQTSETPAVPAESSTSDAVRVPQVVVPITARPDSDEEGDAPATPVVMATFQTILDEYATDEIDGALARERHDDYMEVRPELADSATTVSDTSTEPARRVPSTAVVNKQNNWEDLVPIGGPPVLVTTTATNSGGGDSLSAGGGHTMTSEDSGSQLAVAPFTDSILESPSARYAYNASISSASPSVIPRLQQPQSIPGQPSLLGGGGSVSRRTSYSAGATSYADIMSMPEGADASFSPQRTFLGSGNRGDVSQFSLSGVGGAGGGAVLGARSAVSFCGPNTPSLLPFNSTNGSGPQHPPLHQLP